MFTLMLSFLRTHWQTTLIASLVFSVAGTFSLQRFEIHHLGRELMQCHGENAALEASNKALLSSIQDQNAALASLEIVQRNKKNAAAQALSSARAHADLHDHNAQSIKAQPQSKDECADMRKLVDGFVSGAAR